MTTTRDTYLLRWAPDLASAAKQAAEAARLPLSKWVQRAVQEKLDRGAALQARTRPGRTALVPPDLAALHGPTGGKVELPLRLYWSGEPGQEFDLSDPDARRWLYEIVIREASTPEDLTAWLDGVTLIAEWVHLRDNLPRIRQAWESQHPVLLAAAARAA